MNKKVSTLLTVAMVLGGSLLSSSAFAQTYKKIGADATFEKENFDGKTKLYLAADASGDNQVQYVSSVVNVKTAEESSSSLWTVSTETVGGTTYYTLKNATNGKVLMFNSDGAYTESENESNKPVEYALTNGNFAADPKFEYLTASAREGTPLTIGSQSAGTYTDAELSVALPIPASAVSTLNTLAGDHFSLTFPDLKNLQGNVFANELVALTSLISGFDTETGEVLFAIKSSVPESILKTGVIPAEGSLTGIQFVVLNPNGTAPVSGLTDGYTFKTIDGRYLVKDNVDPTTTKIEDNQISIENAKFKVEEEQINKKGEYLVSLDKAYVKADGKYKELNGSPTAYYVNAFQGGDNYYVAIQSGKDDLKAFKAGTTIYATAADVLKVKAISVVNIYNMTDEDGAPYGKALSNITDNDNKKAEWVAPKDLQLDAPEAQWIITSKDGKFTFANRENGKKYENVSLFKTDDANVYTAQLDGEEVLNGQTIKLVYKTVTATDGFAVLDSEDLDTYTYNVGFNAPQFNSPFFITEVLPEDEGDNSTAELSQDETKAAALSIAKYANSAEENVLNVTDTIYSIQDYSFINDKKEVENKQDTLKVLAYTFNLTNAAGDKFYLANNSEFQFVEGEEADVREKNNASSIRVVLKKAAAGYTAYSLETTTLTNDKKAIDFTKVVGMDANGALKIGAEAKVTNMVIEKVLPGTSLDMTNGHVKFAAQGGGYFALNEKNEGVMAQTVLKAAATEEDLTFYLDTVDAEALVPSFYITKGVKAEAETKAAEATRLYMYHPAADSLKTFNAAEAKYELNENYAVGTLEDHVAKVVFREAARNGNTIELTQDGEKVTVAAKAEGDVLGGVNDFRFQIVQAGDEEGVYYIKCGNDYVSNFNNVLVYSDKKSAQAVVVEAAEAPTSNEGVVASEVKVVAQDGAVVVKNAAGKNVVVSTILGQVVANEVLTSDNATINVPAGIVVVAVEGESFKVNVK